LPPDAERAVRTGFALAERIGRLNTQASLETRIGIATGLVVVGDLSGVGIAIERQMKMGWSQFVTFVTETEAIVAPDQTDPKAELLRRYATVRKIAAPFLEAFTFKATPSAKPIIDALDVLKALYRTGQRSLPGQGANPLHSARLAVSCHPGWRD